MDIETTRKHIVFTGLVALVLLLAAMFIFSSPQTAASDTSTPITGYAWSDTVGWISMSGSNYGLTVNSGGVVTGYAWSDNIGWVSANSSDLSGCPTSPCAANIQNGNLTGWLRALAGGSAQSGGWDGWISLSGTSPAYGVTLNETTGDFSGYAWGSDVVGWIDFSQVHSGFSEAPPCQDTQGNFCTGNDIYHRDAQCAETFVSTCSYQCSNGACVAPPSPHGTLAGNAAITADPSIIPSGLTTIIAWGVANAASCSVSGDNGDHWSGTSGSETSSSITQQTVYTLTCTDLSGDPFVQSVTVNIIPVFREI